MLRKLKKTHYILTNNYELLTKFTNHSCLLQIPYLATLIIIFCSFVDAKHKICLYTKSYKQRAEKKTQNIKEQQINSKHMI
jgi:hypothetical protein